MALVALDAMGGDHAPGATVSGGWDATQRGHEVVLVGDETALALELKRIGADLPIIHASQNIEMDENPAKAIRQKPDSSILTCARLVKEGKADAYVSAGSTGAAMAAAAVVLGRISGVHRPAIASIFPIPGRPIVVLDSGANRDCKPEHLSQFGVLGSLVAETYLGIEEPRVGLLNIGEEPSKGRDLERAAFALLSEAPIRFVGNVEGRDISSGKADVFVTDGFTGNVVLKTTEGAVEMVARFIEALLEQRTLEELQAIRPLLNDLERRVHHEEYGGAHLLGTEGVVVIAHGSSSPRAVANAVSMAAEAADRGLLAKTIARMAQ